MADEVKYKIDLDRSKLFARLTLFGLWDRDTVDNYSRDVGKAFDDARAATGSTEQYCILIDLRKHGVQSREVSDEIQGRLMKGLAQASRVAVLVSPSTLHKMQAQRLGAHIQAQFFADESEAIAWLSSG